jgi:hypothetical protein
VAIGFLVLGAAAEAPARCFYAETTHLHRLQAAGMYSARLVKRQLMGGGLDLGAAGRRPAR